jgi:NAD(P)-dependent dehydrogenase (short-subunit alcohol dehydrogenase family)
MNVPIKSETITAARMLSGRVSLVTGSTSGIGLGIARALAAAGSEIVLNGFGTPENIAEAQAQIAAEFNVGVPRPRAPTIPGTENDTFWSACCARMGGVSRLRCILMAAGKY